MSKSLILVTGATGFIGSHVLSQLLEKGYPVRASVRSAAKLRGIFPNAKPEQLEIVEVSSVTADHTAALKGVGALVHVASPGPGRGVPTKDIFKGAYEGTLNIVKQAVAAGVKKIVITGTMASLLSADFAAAFGTTPLSEKDFGSATLETFDYNQENEQAVYAEAKTIADKKVWEIAREHPDVDFTVILPPLVFGPVVPNFPLNSSPSSMGTNEFVYYLLTSGPDSYHPNPVSYLADVRDIARAHLAALDVPPIPGRNKRFVVAYGKFTNKEIVDLVRQKRPELAAKLPREDVVPPPQTSAPLDSTFTKEVLGITKYIPIEETVLAAVDLVAEWQKKFAANV